MGEQVDAGTRFSRRCAQVRYAGPMARHPRGFAAYASGNASLHTEASFRRSQPFPAAHLLGYRGL